MSECACPSTDESDADRLELACCGRLPKHIADRIDFIGTIARGWATLGVFLPLALVVIPLVSANIANEGAAAMGLVWVAPLSAGISVATYFLVFTNRAHVLLMYEEMSDTARSEVESDLQMAGWMFLVGGFSGAVAAAAIDVAFFSTTPIGGESAGVLPRVALWKTVAIQIVATAAFASYAKNSNLRDAPVYAVILVTATALAVGLAHVL